MSMKSRMLAMLGIYGALMQPIPKLESEVDNHPKGKRHRTFGKEITSFGQRHIYGKLPRKKFYQEKIDARRREHEASVWELNQEGIIWTPVGLFWKTRKLAEMN